MLGVFGGSFSDTKAIDDHCDLCCHRSQVPYDELLIVRKSEVCEGVCVPENWSDFLNIELRCEGEMVPHNQALSIKLKPRIIVGVSKCSLPFSSTFSAVSFGEVV